MQKHSVVYGLTPGRIDIFWCSLDETSLMHSWSDGSQWNTETIAQGDHPYAPAAAVYPEQPGKMDVGWTERWGKIKYRQFNGGRWLDPMELNPSTMTAASGSPPSNFHPGSTLAGCPNPANRRSGNTEFFVSDVHFHLWNLSFDGTTWRVADCHIDRKRFDPVQVNSKLIWCDQYGNLFINNDWSNPNSANANILLDGATLELPPTVIEGLTSQRTDIFWADGDLLFNQVWDGAETNPTWNQKRILPDGGMWKQTGDRVQIKLNGQTRDGSITAGMIMSGSGSSGDNTYSWTATQLAADPRAATNNLDDTTWQCRDADDNLVRSFEFTISSVTNGGVIVPGWKSMIVNDYDESRVELEHYTSAAPAAAVYGLRPGRVDLFWRSEKGALRNTYFDGKTWRTDAIATDLPLHALPTAIYNPAEQKVHVFWLDAEGGMRNASSDGVNWTTERVSFGSMMMQPAASAGYLPGRMDIFWCGADQNMKQTTGDGAAWNTSPLNLGPVTYTYPSTADPNEVWNFSPPQVVNIYPGHLASLVAANADAGQLEVFWGDLNGQLFLYQFDGIWHITSLPLSVSTAPPPSNFRPDNWFRPPDESFWMKSGPAFCRLSGNDLVYWIDGANRLCETTRWNRPSNYLYPYWNYQPLSTTNPWSGDWKTTVVDFNPGNYSNLPNRDAWGMPIFRDPPRRRDTNFPAPSFAAFTPVALNGPTPRSLQLFLFDNNPNLWQVTLDLDADQMTPPYTAQLLNPGPLAFPPAAAEVPPVNNQGGGRFLFWCNADDKSLRQSRLNGTAGISETLTIDPGPVCSAPVAVVTPSGELHLFWTGANGNLKHKSVTGDAIGNGSASNGWRATEVAAFGPMGSAPFPVYNLAQQKIYVFWLQGAGELMQTSLSESAPPSTRWQTVNLVPAVASGQYHATAGGR